MLYFPILNIFIYIYSSIYRRNIKRKYLLCGLVQDHHIIPRQFKNYINYNNSNSFLSHIDDSKNLIILPNTKGKYTINTNRPIHENGHRNYNKYILNLLENNYTVNQIIPFMKKQLRNNQIIKLI
jgi:hypothetical protein